MKILSDSFGRKFPYIRLSITDVCNFRCTYCLPQGYKKNLGDMRSFMSAEEISRLVKAFRTRCLQDKINRWRAYG